jgi:hypothetical protein
LQTTAQAAATRSTETVGDLIARLTEETEKASQTLQTVARSTTARSSETVGGLVARLAEQTDKASQALEANAHSATVRSTAMVGDLVARLAEETEKTTQALASASDVATKRSGEAIFGLLRRVIGEVEKSTQVLNATADAVGQRSAESIGGLLARLTEETQSSGQLLREAAEIAATTSRESIGGLLARLTEETQSSGQALRQAAESAAAASHESVGGLLDKLTHEIDASSKRLVEAADLASTRSTEAVATHLGRVTDELEGANAALRGTAEAATRQSHEALKALFEELSGNLAGAGEALRETVESGARNSVTSLSSTGDRLRGELALVLEKLGQTGAALDRVVASASGRLGEIQGNLGDRVLDLQRALGAIATQVGELDRISGVTREEGDRFVERLSGHATSLSEVSRELTANQETIDDALARRHDSLRALVTDVGAQSSEFERLMREFSASVERNFATAQARAKEIGAELANAANGAASDTTGRFEEIRASAERERQRSEEALRAAYDQANAQLSGIMEQMAQKFRASVSEVKDMAAEVQRELDATRGELKRGVFELPKETTEAADAMRRVVGDQIKALKELAAVVAPHGFDLAEPEEARPSPPARLQGFARREPAAPPREPEPSTEIALAPPPVVILPPTPERAPEEPPAEPPPLRPAAPAPANANAANARAQSGWLSNLLAAASRDVDEPRPPLAPRRPSNEGLDSITTDIARLVDSTAAGEIWERWRQGDTGAVSRRLYTAAGQQAFEDIRRRLRTEPAFRESVNRYVGEFERLLAKIGQNDRDGAQSRAAMLSDSGKVYMLLAHASGRLG